MAGFVVKPQSLHNGRDAASVDWSLSVNEAQPQVIGSSCVAAKKWMSRLQG
jgi:hypothetical protein